MKNLWAKITIIGAIIAGAIFAVLKFVLVPAKKSEQDFPGAKKKEEIKLQIVKTEEELKEIDEKEYTREEIEDKFNS